jgi:hypothetical protein
MKPERENTLVDLLDRLLNKGLILNADVIISVAGVPLIAISLKAAIASMETMLEYGMMEAWDEKIRGESILKNRTDLSECICPVQPLILPEKHA